MAYKNPLDERAKEARRKHYQNNKEQYLERNRQHKSKLIQSILDIKNSNSCVDCGDIYIDEPWMTEFDHIGNDKIAGIAVLVSRGVSLKKLLEEVDKCELVCVRCHRRRTAQRGNWKPNRYMT